MHHTWIKSDVLDVEESALIFKKYMDKENVQPIFNILHLYYFDLYSFIHSVFELDDHVKRQTKNIDSLQNEMLPVRLVKYIVDSDTS